MGLLEIVRSASGRFNRIAYRRHIRFYGATRLLGTTAGTSEQLTSDQQHRVLDERASTVVIGGGVVGVSIAYHLAKLGQKNVVLLEKSELTAGSTWHAAGLTTYYNPGINVKRLHYNSLQLYDSLERETGQNVGLHKCGTLRIASSPERVDEFRYQMSRQNWNKAQQRLVWPDEIRRLHPLLNMNRVEAGLYTAGDGHIDPYSLTQALAIGARMYGADIRSATPVVATKQQDDGSWVVETAQGGAIRADRIVNAAGLWARELGKLAGLNFPLVPVHHQYIVTGPINAVQQLDKELPVIRDLSGGYYMRQERQGLLWGPYEHESKMKLCDDWYRDGVPPGFGKELFESDLERLQEHIEYAMDLVPALNEAEIQRVVCGPITYSPDILPMVGPVRGVANYWCAVGFGYGIIHAGGVGRYLADWILANEPPYDLIELDPDRYGRWTDGPFTLKKSRESYGFNNVVGFPKEERPAGRPTSRLSPIYDRLAARGAQFGFHSGWEQPNWFARPGDQPGYQPSFRRTNWFRPVIRECQMVMNGAGVIDLTPFGKFTVKGRDASRLLDHVTANALPAVGRTNITHLLTDRGNVYAEWTISRLADDEYFCITGSASELHDLRWLEKVAWWGCYEVSILNETDLIGCLGLAGPTSREVLGPLLGDKDYLSDESWPFLHARRVQVAGVQGLAVRISYTGELGWEIYVTLEDLPTLYDALAGSTASPVGDFGTYAMNALRIEKGFRAWGSEMNVDVGPFEAGLDPFIRVDKPIEFIGREAARSARADGQRKRLVTLSLANSGPEHSDAVDPSGNEAVWFGDRVVGNTTSGAYCPTVGRSLAFAYLPSELTIPGTVVDVELIGHRIAAVVERGAPVKVESVRTKLMRRQQQKKKTSEEKKP